MGEFSIDKYNPLPIPSKHLFHISQKNIFNRAFLLLDFYLQVLPGDRPKAHQKYLEWNPSRIVRWAKESGLQTAAVVQAIMDSKDHPEQGFRACLGLIRLGERYTKERLEAACARALIFDTISYRSVKSILEKGLDRFLNEEGIASEPIQHHNLRGSQYYDQKGQPLC